MTLMKNQFLHHYASTFIHESCSIQHVMGLCIRAGLAPLLVGGPGSGKRGMIEHLASCWDVHSPLQTKKLRLALSVASRPEELQELLLWHMVPSGSSSVRPRAGHQLLLVVEDLHVPVRSSRPPNSLSTSSLKAVTGVSVSQVRRN